MNPKHQTFLSAGADVSASKETVIFPKEIRLVGTGYYLPTHFKTDFQDYCILLYPRSSLAIKKGLMLANSVGVIDIDYNQEIKVALYNPTASIVKVDKFERIAQLVMQPIIRPWPINGEKRVGGFGSTDRSPKIEWRNISKEKQEKTV